MPNNRVGDSKCPMAMHGGDCFVLISIEVDASSVFGQRRGCLRITPAKLEMRLIAVLIGR